MKKTISERIDGIAEMNRSAICYKTSLERYTYGELKDSSDRIARFLLTKVGNLEQQSSILVYGGLDFEMIAIFLGCLKAGVTYIPVDSQSSKERVDLVVSIAKPILILAVQEFVSKMDTLVPIIEIEQIHEIMYSQHVGSFSNQYVQGDSNAYIIFTSGTTGIPKGVQITQDNLSSFTEWMLTDFKLGNNKKYLSQAPFSFDLSVMSIYPALLSGGSILPIDNQLSIDFKKLFENLPKMGIEIWVSTPSYVEICLLDEHFNHKNYREIETFLFCGEELTTQTSRVLTERFPSARIINTYGPTEATVAMTKVTMTPFLLSKDSRLPVGRVKPDSKVFIVNDQLKPVQEGLSGEIVIVGPSVSKGYLNNPDKTATSFYKIDGEQAYRTGDIGQFNGDLLFYQGRLDFQVKLHGYRVELEDIDFTIEKSSYVQSAIVVPKYKENKVQNLVAYVIPKSHHFEKEYQLTKAIKKDLVPIIMNYMLPTKWVYVEKYPLTVNGKIDRKSLIYEVNT